MFFTGELLAANKLPKFPSNFPPTNPPNFDKIEIPIEGEKIRSTDSGISVLDNPIIPALIY